MGFDPNSTEPTFTPSPNQKLKRKAFLGQFNFQSDAELGNNQFGQAQPQLN